MNVYFLVEGKQTEQKIYPEWLSILVPEISRVGFFDEVHSRNYKLFSGNGFPHLLNHLEASIDDINTSGNYDFFVICLDSDDFTIDERVNEIKEFIANNDLLLHHGTQLRIIVQQKCIESWLLGNKKIFKTNPQDETLTKSIKFYNVSENDPELMPKPQEYIGSTADYHYGYLKAMLKERNIQYTKRFPRVVIEPHYLSELIKRNNENDHLKSFQSFLDLCNELNSTLLIHN